MKTIPGDQAFAICEQVQTRNRGKWYTYQTWWCWGCTTFTKGDPTKRCYANAPDNRGCQQVSQVFDAMNPDAAQPQEKKI